MQVFDRFGAWVEQFRFPWWAWPAALVSLAVLADIASLTLQPMGAEWVAWPTGGRFGDTCAMITATGLPCPQCGMTRSWVHGIRGDWVAAWGYNPAGLTLWMWLNAGGIVGLLRLARRAPGRFGPPVWLLFGWTVFWLIPLYTVGYGLRIAGWNPLP